MERFFFSSDQSLTIWQSPGDILAEAIFTKTKLFLLQIKKKAPRIVAIWELDAPWCLPGMQGPSSQCWNGDVSDVTLLILVDPACYGVLWGIRCIRCRRAMCLRWYSFVGKYHRGEMKIDEAPSTVQPSLNSVALWIRAKELNACNFM